MGSGNGYEVDLSYLQQAVTQLQSVADGMDGTKEKANYQTNLTPGQFGGEGFLEAQTLYGAHDAMKTDITNMIGTLQSMIQEFQGKTSSAHKAYSDQETNTAGGFNKGMS
ncbi:hypothetical protein [Streptacidiphilus fuscans]|uniref:Uncharacterized protein n=1 Tax=Streptacidiphilus fuscans TaxID=2789292 RepID=A0A931B9V0_9ACTN|nr:hypothetical protein [Streptacidiphilus fuscans]MBF9070403.1 hypothetical protein [Streptacidiphilus fuscans]